MTIYTGGYFFRGHSVYNSMLNLIPEFPVSYTFLLLLGFGLGLGLRLGFRVRVRVRDR